MGTWQRYFFRRKESLRTTWTFRVGVVLIALLAAVVTRGFWADQIAQSLVCSRDPAPSDVIVLENFDPRYVLFERAEELERAGLAPRVLVPVQASPDEAVANAIFAGIAGVMARYARIKVWDVLPVREVEPISLNAAVQVRDRLARDGVKSLILVTPGFRSRRSMLVYHA